MFTRYINILFIIGFVVMWAVCGIELPYCQTQSLRSSAHDTTTQWAEEEKRPRVTRERVEYKSRGRDPFSPLFEKKEEEEELPLLEVEGATLVGVMTGENGGLVLVQDTEGRTYVLRQGTRIKNGYLRRIRSHVAVFNVAKYGRYRKVELELKSEKRAESFERGVIEIAQKPKVVPKPQLKPPLKPPEGLRAVKASADSKFTLQVAAFRRKEDARRLQQWLQGRGYETRIEVANLPESGQWYRVRHGVYETYGTGKEVAESFRKRFDFYCWIVPIDS